MQPRSLSPFERKLVKAVISSEPPATRRDKARTRTVHATEPATTRLVQMLIQKFFPATLDLDDNLPRQTVDQAAAACICTLLFLFGMLRLSNQTTQVTKAQAKNRAEHHSKLAEAMGLSIDVDQLEEEIRQDNALLVRDVVFGSINRTIDEAHTGWEEHIVWRTALDVAANHNIALWVENYAVDHMHIRFVGILSPVTKQHQLGNRPLRLLIDSQKHPLHADVVRMMSHWALYVRHTRLIDLFWSRLYDNQITHPGRYVIPMSRIDQVTKIVYKDAGKDTRTARANGWKHGGATLIALGQTLHNNPWHEHSIENTIEGGLDSSSRERARITLGHSSLSSTGHYINNIQGGLGTLPRMQDPEQDGRDASRSTFSSTLFRNAYSSTGNAPDAIETTSSRRSNTPRGSHTSPKRVRRDVRGAQPRHPQVNEPGTRGDPSHRPN